MQDCSNSYQIECQHISDRVPKITCPKNVCQIECQTGFQNMWQIDFRVWIDCQKICPNICLDISWQGITRSKVMFIAL